MNPTVTTEELLALSKSADLLRQTAEKAMRFDSLARELRSARNDRDHLAGILEKIMQIFEGHPDLGPQDFSELPLEVSALHDMYNEELDRNRKLVRENETLARNMPPEPPDDSVFWNPYNGVVQDHRDGTVIQPDTDKERAKRGLPPFEMPESVLDTPFGAAGRVTKVIGQQWCRGNASEGHIGVAYPGGRLVLCEVHQDVQTGALTYHPLSVKDLPIVP